MADKLLNLINLLFATHCSLDPRESYPRNYSPKSGDIFDFIIVGGGTAGSVLAGRLSENRKWNVLLLEAGEYPTVATEIPTSSATLVKSELDWNYQLETSNTSCLGFENQKCSLPKGKVLGGTGSMNGMAHVRGTKEDYDKWEKMGNFGWDWKSVYPYFRRAEHSVNIVGGNYGTNGPVAVSYYKSRNRLRNMLIESALEAGISVGSDEQNLGLFEYMMNTEDGTRSSSAEGYIASSKQRKNKNLHLALGALVENVIIENNRAIGVKVIIRGKRVNLFSRKEVIISAGVIGSPQILMLSGIGPKEHLADLGISVIQNLRVGKNFHDHVGLRGLFFKLNLNETNSVEDRSSSALEYCVNRTGSYTGDGNLNFMLSQSAANDDIPDSHIQMTYVPKNTTGAIKLTFENMGVRKYITDSVVELGKQNDMISFSLFLAKPKFRGEILLRSKNPLDKPRILSNLLTDKNEEDMANLIYGIESLKKLLDTQTMQKYNAEMLRLDIKECNSIQFDTTEFWKCQIRHLAYFYYHSVGTCKMGPKTDENAVVNSKLQVYGIRRLRVIDASIMPEVVSRNTNAPTLMIAEKGAAMILKKYDSYYLY